MRKIVAFVGSPRKNGFSTKLLNQVIEGAKSAGAEVITYNLNNEKIKGCQGCFYCRKHEGCATKDALQPMYRDIQEADGIVASFPIYFAGISGQAKSWMDRMAPMLDAEFKPRYPEKKVVTIYAQGNADPNRVKGVIDGNNMFFKMFGWELVQSFIIYNTHDTKMKIEDSMMQEAFQAGKALLR